MQLIEVRRVSRRRKSLRYALLLGAALLVTGGWLAVEPGLARYRAWKRQHALAQAREFIGRNDVVNTQLALDVALRSGPSDPDTIRVAADMLEQVGAPQAMRLRRAIVRMTPESATDAAALVRCCLRFRDYNGAKDALHAMPSALAAQPVALEAALAYALATDDAPVADYLLRQLREHRPDNDGLAYTHAVLRLRLPRAADRATAAAELAALAERHPDLRTRVARELAGAALQRQDYAAAAEQLQRVLAAPDATLSDRLQLANLELVIQHQPFAEVFGRVAPRAGAAEADAAAFLQWLVVQDRADDAAGWLATLSSAIRQSNAVLRMEADIAARRHDGDRLNELLRAGVWGPLTPETLRLISAAMNIDTPERPALRQEVWDMAVTSASGSLAALNALLRLTTAWHWHPEFERTEWALARAFPDQTWAFQDLFNFYRQKKDTNGMRDVLTRLRDSDGAVPRYQHDWALLSLLLSQTRSWDTPKSILQQLYESHPKDATYATAYAFALAQADRAAEAIKVLADFSSEDLSYPPRQPYLAFVYGVARMKPELERTSGFTAGSDYLPEERRLFLLARDALVRAPDEASAAATVATTAKP